MLAFISSTIVLAFANIWTWLSQMQTATGINFITIVIGIMIIRLLLWALTITNKGDENGKSK